MLNNFRTHVEPVRRNPTLEISEPIIPIIIIRVWISIYNMGRVLKTRERRHNEVYYVLLLRIIRVSICIKKK